MLTDNFPFKAYASEREDSYVQESTLLPQEANSALDRLMLENQVSKEVIIFTLMSVYLHKYMEDTVISTVCVTGEKTSLLKLPIDGQKGFGCTVKECYALANKVEDYFIDEDFVVIRVNTHSHHTDEPLAGECQFLLDVLLTDKTSSISLSYRKSTLLNGAGQLIVHQLSHLIKNIDDLWSKNINDILLMTNVIRDNILNEFRVQHQTFDYHYGLYQRFSDQVKAKGDSTAIVFSDKELTYQQLNQAVNELATTLFIKGARKGQRIAVFLNRSDHSVTSILAILKLGCSYIPLDSTYPGQYINNIQKETGFKFVLSESSLIGQLDSVQCEAIDVENIDPQHAQAVHDIPEIFPQPLDEFAILYTSGTTGKPKGAIYNHASPLNKFSWMWDFFKFDEIDVFLQRTSVNFSPSLWEMFGALLIGLKTVIVSDDTVRDPAKLMQAIKKEKVTFMGVVPALLRMLFEGDKKHDSAFDQLKYISCSGEPMQVDLYQKIKSLLPNVRLFNDYGSTEMNAVGYSEITDESTQSKNFPIGKPISNVHYYILDNDLQLVPPFMTGNLYIGGISLLNDYVGPVQSPFINDPILNTGIPFFKSGDKARFLADGKIELVGRDDFVVKVRGMRVSLYQVETVIKSHKNVADACVVSRKNSSGENEIVVYLSSDESILAIRNYCLSELPEYMVPVRFIAYGTLPKKTNGKLDRKYLADLAASERQEETANIINPDDIKASVFELTRVVFAGSHSDPDCPFSLLGMTSLDAVVLTARVNQTWSLNITVTALLQYDTVNRLSQYIESVIKEEPIKLAAKEDLVTEVSTYSTQYPLLANTLANTLTNSSVNTRHGDTQNILVTGANGFLGTCVVVSLLKNTSSNIYCVVRASSQTQAEQKLKRSLFQCDVGFEFFQNRIKVICAEISKDFWGMKESEYTDLTTRIDGVFHLAANTNHFSDYLSLKEANVIATKNIIDFCFLKKSKTIIFSSSISVLLKHSGEGYYVDKHEGLVSSEGLYNGYGKTKWVAEQLLDHARKRGLNTGIIRLGELSFHSQTGFHREDDIFHNCLTLIANMESGPEWQDGYINCLAVDKVADALIRIFFQIHQSEKDSHSIFNLVSHESVAMESVLPGNKKLPFSDWLEACKAHINANETNYPPAFSSFFDNGNDALIKEYFKDINVEANAYDELLGGDYLQNLSIRKEDIKGFYGTGS